MTGQGLKKKKAPPPPPGAGGTKEHKQQSSLSLSSTDQDISEPHKKTTSLERHLSGKNSTGGSDHSPDKCSTLPGKMKMSEHDYRPVESAGKKSKITPETKMQSPEEGCLDGDQKIPELEEDTCVPDISKQTSLFHSQTYQDTHDIATPDQSSDKNVAEKQNECFEQLQVPTVETTPETPVELVSKSRSPQVVDADTPEGKTATGKLEMDTCLPFLRGMWNLEEVPPGRCKGTIFNSFSDKTSPMTSKHSADLRIPSPFCRRYSDYGVKLCSSKQRASETETSYDVYDHKNTNLNSKRNGKTVQVLNSALSSAVSTATTNCISENELCNLINPNAKININDLQCDISNKPNHKCCKIVKTCSSSNSKQKVVKPDSQNYQTVITRSSSMTTQQSSGFKVTASQKTTHGVNIHNCSAPKNVISSAKLDDMRSHLMSGRTECSSVIPQEKFIHKINWNDITDIPDDRSSTFWKSGSSIHNSPAVSTQECDGSTTERQPNPRIRVSLLVPPPADFLISRGESSQSWNKFLQDLNKILENRAKFV
jgi:hypothetical protein